MKLPVVRKKSDSDSQSIMPFEQQFSDFHSAVDRLFNDFWRGGFPAFPATSSLFNRGLTTGGWWPKTDVSETDKEVKIKLNIPNVDPDKVSLEVDEDSLVISGSTEKDEEQEGENWYRMERESGEFRRVFDLPSGCNIDEIKASSKHGTLYVTIPKKPEAQKKKVTIDVKS